MLSNFIRRLESSVESFESIQKEIEEKNLRETVKADEAK